MSLISSILLFKVEKFLNKVSNFSQTKPIAIILVLGSFLGFFAGPFFFSSDSS